jgi:hypothetical protein
MNADCKISIAIEDGEEVDLSTFGFHLMKSPSLLGYDIKENSILTTDFPEENGSRFYILPTPPKKSFDYQISLLYFENSLYTANAKIVDFCESIFGKKITIRNYYKGVLVVGYVKTYTAGEFYRNAVDAISFDLSFFVPRPQDCLLKDELGNFSIQFTNQFD